MSDLHPLTGAYAVDALDDLERVRFERHLTDCPDCAAEVASLTETASFLSSMLPTAPSAATRAAVLEQIREVRPLPPAVSPTERVRSTARRFRQVLSAAAAVVVLAAGIGIGTWHPWREQPQPAAVTLATKVLNASDAKTQTFAVSGGGHATLVHSASINRAVITTRDMPKAPYGQVYELWLQDAKGVMIPAGTMTGGLDTTVVLDGQVKGSTGVGITVEPSSGSDKPTTNPIALVPLKSA